MHGAVGCAAAPTKTSPTTATTATTTAADDGASSAADAADEPDAPPASWAEALDRYGSSCPVPSFTMATPAEVILPSGVAFQVLGSSMVRKTPRPPGAVVFGVVGAVKDADADTAENLRVAAAAFAKAGAQFVVVNGDLVGDETGAMVPVVAMLGETFSIPVFAHSGNYEWTSAFTSSMADAAVAHPQLFNMNIIRHVDLGGVHLLSLPGYFNRRFIHNGACHYDADDVDALMLQAKALRAGGGVVVLTSHGPPLGKNDTGLDVTNDGENVGDPQLTKVLKAGDVSVGVFSHILESGGRATADVEGGALLKLPMKKAEAHLAINVGAATAFPWQMVEGRTARGMAAIVTVDTDVAGGAASVSFVSLR